MKTGVYALVFNTHEGERMYIGSTISGFSTRLSVHNLKLRNGRHHNAEVQRLWDIYKKFTFVILEEMGIDKKIVREAEKRYIKKYGNKVINNDSHHSLETRRKIGEATNKKWDVFRILIESGVW